MNRRPDSTCRAILAALKRAMNLDPLAVKRVVMRRVDCNDMMADDRWIQCRQFAHGHVKVGVLGLLNAITQPKGFRLEAMFEGRKLIGFRLRSVTQTKGESK